MMMMMMPDIKGLPLLLIEVCVGLGKCLCMTVGQARADRWSGLVWFVLFVLFLYLRLLRALLLAVLARQPECENQYSVMSPVTVSSMTEK